MDTAVFVFVYCALDPMIVPRSPNRSIYNNNNVLLIVYVHAAGWGVPAGFKGGRFLRGLFYTFGYKPSKIRYTTAVSDYYHYLWYYYSNSRAYLIRYWNDTRTTCCWCTSQLLVGLYECWYDLELYYCTHFKYFQVPGVYFSWIFCLFASVDDVHFY